MESQITFILFTTLHFLAAKGVQGQFIYDVSKYHGSKQDHLQRHDQLRQLPRQRSRREVSPTNISVSSPVQYNNSDAGPSSVLSTTILPTVYTPTKKLITQAVTTVVPLAVDNNLSTVSDDVSLLTNPPKSVLQSTTPNFTIIEDNHRYYRSRVATSEELASYWIDEKTMYAASRHDTLSESYRSAATIQLSFSFSFYGHEVNQVTIATGGFLYMSDFLHQWLTATQYIAPLMANFDTQLGNMSHIRHLDNGTVFVVWWQDVYLQDNHDVGFFSFQVMLHKDGRIIFSYKQIPVDITEISDERHPVKIGLSDAFVVTRQFFYLRQRTIYEYHRVEINMSQVVNNSAIIITPLPTCQSLKTCEDCINMSSTVVASFQCHWCPSLSRCSDGLDRNRQEWLDSNCDQLFPDTVDKCATLQKHGWKGPKSSSRTFSPSSEVSIATAVSVTIVLTVVGAAVVWCVYAYKNPNSRSGMWLIQNRPNKLIERVRQMKRGSRISSKYEVAMQPEAESFA